MKQTWRTKVKAAVKQLASIFLASPVSVRPTEPAFVPVRTTNRNYISPHGSSCSKFFYTNYYSCIVQTNCYLLLNIDWSLLTGFEMNIKNKSFLSQKTFFIVNPSFWQPYLCLSKVKRRNIFKSLSLTSAIGCWKLVFNNFEHRTFLWSCYYLRFKLLSSKQRPPFLGQTRQTKPNRTFNVQA